MPDSEGEFTLTPCHPRDEIIKMKTKEGYNHYRDATAKLSEDLYDCDEENFYQFMKVLKDRADEFGWSGKKGILSIGEKSLLVDYGSISYESVKAQELEYIDKNIRRTQDTTMLYKCIMSSLSSVGRAKLNIHDDMYIIGENKRKSGVCLLKILIRESYLDSNATSTMIRFELSNLDDYLAEVNNDILQFNAHVKVLIDTLHSRGETTQDLLTNLFKAYAACSDQVFVRYMSDCQTKWEDNEAITADELMLKAAKKYKTLKTKKLWEAPSAQDEKIIAMEATITDMKRKFKSNQGNDGNKGGNKGGRKGGKEGSSSKKGKYDPDKKKPSWMFKRPKDADLHKPREWNGAKWHFCSPETGGKCRGVYRIHKPSQCKSPGTPKKDKDDEDKGKNKGKNGEDTEVVVAQQALDDPLLQSDEELNGGYESE